MSALRRWWGAIASTKDYWLISGGKSDEYDNDYISNTTVFDADFTESSVASPVNREGQLGVNFHENAVFADGSWLGNVYRDVIVYDSNLTYSQYYTTGVCGKCVSGATTKTHLILAGSAYNGNSANKSVEAFDEDFTRSQLDYLTEGVCSMATASLGGNALFYGGVEYSYSSYPALREAYVYDDDFTKQDIDNLPEYSFGVAAASLGSQVVLAGGGLPNSNADTDDAYVMDASLTRTPIAALSIYRINAGGVNLGDTALIIGGNSRTGNSRTAEYYDSDLTQTVQLNMDNFVRFKTLSGNQAGVAVIGDQALVYCESGYTTLMKFHSE